jgi:hypothetical protein
MPITSNQPNKTVIYEIFNWDDALKWVPWKAAVLEKGDMDVFNKGKFKLRILIQLSFISRAIVFDDNQVYQDSDSFIVNAGDVVCNGKVANLYYGG